MTAEGTNNKRDPDSSAMYLPVDLPADLPVSQTSFYCIFDSNYVLTDLSPDYTRLYPTLEDDIRKGITYSDYLRLIVEKRVVVNIGKIDDLDQWVAAQYKAARHNPGFIHQLQDGRIMDVKCIVTASRDFLFISSDITHHVSKQKELKHTNARFQSFATLAADWYWELDGDLKYVFHSNDKRAEQNRAGGSRIGEHRIEMLADEHVWDEQLERHNNCLRDKTDVDALLTVICKAGQKKYHHVLAKPLYENEGKFSGFVGCGRDITEQTLVARLMDSHNCYEPVTQLINSRALDVELGEWQLKVRQNQRPATICVINLGLNKGLSTNGLGTEQGKLLKMLCFTIKRVLDDCKVIGLLENGHIAALVASDVHLLKIALQPLIEQIRQIYLDWGDSEQFSDESISFGLSSLAADINPRESLANAGIACQRAKQAGNSSQKIEVFESGYSAPRKQPLTEKGADQEPSTRRIVGRRIGRRSIQSSKRLELVTDAAPLVAVVMDNMHSFQKYVSRSIAEVLKEAGFDCINIVLSNRDIETGKDESRSGLNLIEHLASSNVCGIIALTSSVGAHMDAQQFYQLVGSIKTVPVVHMGSIEGCENSVELHNHRAMRELLEHVSDHTKCRSLCFVRGFGDLSDSAQREKEFIQFLEDKQLPVDPDFMIDGEFRESITYNAVTGLLESGKIPDAILAANDQMAVAAMRAVQAFGLSVPEDVCVAGFDDRSIATECSPLLTSIRVDLYEYSNQCAQALLKLLEHGKIHGLESAHSTQFSDQSQTATHACRLIIRQSTDRGRDSSYAGLLKEVSRILRDEEIKRKKSSNGSYFRAFMETLTTNSTAFEPVIDELEAFSDIEFDEHNVLRELFAAIGKLLHTTSESGEADAGFLRMSNLNHKISTLVYDAKAKQMLISATDQQSYNTLQMKMLQCHSIDHIIDIIDNTFDAFSLDTAYLVINDRESVRLASSTVQSGESRTLIYARKNGQRLQIKPTVVPSQQLLPVQFDICDAADNLLFHRLTGYGADFGYGIFEIAPLESTLVEKICACITTAINDCRQLEVQKQSADQLRDLNVKLAHKTNYDSTTGLPNRRQCLSQLEQALYESHENSTQFSLMKIRLNDLDKVTLQYGRVYFDFLARTIATTLLEICASDCRVFHTETSEFTVIIQNASESETGQQISRLLEKLEQPYSLAGHIFSVSYNAGTAIYPLHGFNANELIASANAAVEHTIEQSNERHAVFDSSIGSLGVDKWKLDKQMRKALKYNDFCVFFQPRIDTQSGEVIAFESLIRWYEQDDQGKVVHVSTPDVFIPVAEETGFIQELGDYVLNKSCEQLKQWRSDGLHTRLSINLSARELEAEDCVERIVKTLEKHNVDSHDIEIEVTESSAMRDIESTIVKLTELKKNGIEIAIDDFGTAYSSLTYLKRLPAKYLKVDRSFLRDIETADGGNSADAAIVRAVVTLGHSLGQSIVAEGVETKEQLDFLVTLNVEQVQGFYFSPAVDAQSAEKMLRDEKLQYKKTA